MFKQMKSALFWYYLYKFRKRVFIIILLLISALFANAIYADVVEYLKLKEQLQYLEIVLITKWVLILFNISFSIYLILTMFKKEDESKNKETQKKEKAFIKQIKKETKKNSQEEAEKPVVSKETLSEREKSFLYKKSLKSKADVLVDK